MASHPHHHHPRAVASAPTLSLLRASAWQRVLGAGGVLAALWALVWLAID
jgi:hypothetical protein